MIDWYHFNLNHTVGSRIKKSTQEICYWKELVTEAELYDKLFKICQQFKKRKALYVLLPLKNQKILKPWDTAHVYLISTHRKSIRQQQMGGTIIRKSVSLTCMTMIDPTTGLF